MCEKAYCPRCCFIFYNCKENPTDGNANYDVDLKWFAQQKIFAD